MKMAIRHTIVFESVLVIQYDGRSNDGRRPGYAGEIRACAGGLRSCSGMWCLMFVWRDEDLGAEEIDVLIL